MASTQRRPDIDQPLDSDNAVCRRTGRVGLSLVLASGMAFVDGSRPHNRDLLPLLHRRPRSDQNRVGGCRHRSRFRDHGLQRSIGLLGRSDERPPDARSDARLRVPRAGDHVLLVGLVVSVRFRGNRRCTRRRRQLGHQQHHRRERQSRVPGLDHRHQAVGCADRNLRCRGGATGRRRSPRLASSLGADGPGSGGGNRGYFGGSSGLILTPPDQADDGLRTRGYRARCGGWPHME